MWQIDWRVFFHVKTCMLLHTNYSVAITIKDTTDFRVGAVVMDFETKEMGNFIQ
jgi:hypothetical protein